MVLRGSMRVVAWPDTEAEAEAIVLALEERNLIADVVPPVSVRAQR